MTDAVPPTLPGQPPRIVLFSDGPRQAAGLASSLRRARCRVLVSTLAAARFDDRAPMGIAVPGLGANRPDAVLVRSVSAGSFEAVTRRLGILHALGRLGIPVWNSATAIERCVDKSMTTFLLKAAGLQTPATFAVEGLSQARAILRRERAHGPLVFKPLFGSQGEGLRLVMNEDDLPAEAATGGVYYLQRRINRTGPPFRDYRVFVCDGRAIATMGRRSADWITNVTRGAVPEVVPASLCDPLSSLAIAAAAAVGADFAGVDIAEDRKGRLVVIEVNSMPAWAGLQTIAPVRIADEIADALVARLASASPLRRVEHHAASSVK